jgi:hypothetical protein
MAFELLNSAVVLPKFNVVTVDHLPGAFPCAVVVIADEVDGLHKLAVTANKVRSIMGHSVRGPCSGSLSSLTSQRRASMFMGSVGIGASWIWAPFEHRRVQSSNPEGAAAMR